MKTIIFDFDGTLTKKSNEIWRNIWAKLDALDVDDMLYTKFSKGEIDYTEWCKAIEEEYKKRNFNTKILDELISKIEMMENLEESLKELKKEGYDLRILSGGIDYVIKSLLKDNIEYFSDIKSTKFVFDDKGYLNKLIDTDSDEEGKGRYVAKYIKDTNSNPKDIIFVGNGHNDRFVSRTGCITICINPNNTNHEDKNIWSLYIENSDDLKDVVKLIKEISKRKPTIK